MAEKIRVNYQELNEMAQLVDKAAQHLQESTAKLAQKAAQDMQGGTLTGDVGEAFASALGGPFVASVNKLGQKLEEVANDIRAAIRDMQSADRDAAGQF